MAIRLIALILLCGVAVGQTVDTGRGSYTTPLPACEGCAGNTLGSPKPEPFDVPPVQNHGIKTTTIYRQCGANEASTLGPNLCFTEVPIEHNLTCADKRRTLLHSEDGNGHCYAFYQLQEEK